MKQRIKLNESNLHRIVKEVITEMTNNNGNNGDGSGITTYSNPTQNWQRQNNYINQLVNMLNSAKQNGDNELIPVLQQSINRFYNKQSKNFGGGYNTQRNRY